mgnify:CR=1 FL=1
MKLDSTIAAVVTGGASGLGEATARALAAKGMTMIMATHQISLIATLANEILFMEGGDIVEQGSHDELLARRGVYFDLHESQFLGGEEPAPEAQPLARA